MLITLITLVVEQLAAKSFSNSAVSAKLFPAFEGLIYKLALLVRPIAVLPTENPEEFEQELIESVEDFTETIVREVMVPRVDIAAIQADTSLKDAVSVFLSRGFSRLPVIGKSVDDIVGVLFLKDIAHFWSSKPDQMVSTSVHQLCREATFVPESKPVDDLLREMQANATHLVVVVDEYGGVAGIATLEDLIEEIVGEIKDEYDFKSLDIDQIGEHRYRVAAKYSLFELGEHIGIELDDEDVDSVGGLIAKVLGRLPNTGDSISYNGLSLRVERFEPRRKRLVSVIVEVSDAALAFQQESGKVDD
jgi:CBS domain containing-hemolysin-like protein